MGVWGGGVDAASPCQSDVLCVFVFVRTGNSMFFHSLHQLIDGCCQLTLA